MKVIIDRFEEDIAVVEYDGAFYRVPRILMGGAEEGDAVQITPLGRNADAPGGEDPHAIFERLRKRRRQRRSDR